MKDLPRQSTRMSQYLGSILIKNLNLETCFVVVVDLPYDSKSKLLGVLLAFLDSRRSVCLNCENSFGNRRINVVIISLGSCGHKL